MSAPVSVIIPTLNAGRSLPGTAASLMAGLEAGLIRELIVSDGGSEDETVRAADALGARVITGAPGRGGQMARGVAVAKGAWLLLLHADTHLSALWPDAVRRHLDGGPGRAGVFRLEFRADGWRARQTAGWANLRSRVFGLPYGDQGLLIHRKLLDEIGGVPDMPLMEDVALARRLAGRIDLLPATASTDASKYLARGWYRQGAANFWRLGRFLMGADPATLARNYRR